ncbi:hypothetical protein [Actinoplanes subtropicus]|uniref:hypothetical protein n=1 Tax=Actinoplanes subtropicus TaxID=543632 RepID=UPI0004C46404|nr:hypothetical protein [Actinoplanes subtropicus]
MAAAYDRLVREAGGAGQANDGTAALTLDVVGRGRPRLAVHVAAVGRFLLRQGDQAVLLAKMRRDHAGVEYLVIDDLRSPIAPMRATHAAAVAWPWPPSIGSASIRTARWSSTGISPSSN